MIEAKSDRGDDESRLRAIIDQVADGLVIVGGDGLVRFVNPAAEALFGRAADELLGRPFGFPLADGSAEIDVVRPGAGPVVAELRVVAMEWEEEPALLVSLRDITDRKEAEERRRELIREQLARSRAEAEELRARFLADATSTFDSSLDLQVVLGRLARTIVSPLDPRAESTSPAARLADWCVIDLVSRGGGIERMAAAHHDPAVEPLLERLRERYPPKADDAAPSARALRSGEAVLHRKVSDDLLRRLARDAAHADLLREIGLTSAVSVPLHARGETLGAVTLCRAFHPFGEADLVLARDLAQRAALSLANARLYREAREANRAKSDFLAVMSHELRTPLNAIMGYSDLLDAEISGPINEKQREQLGRIAGSSRHLLQIVEEILTYTRMEAGREELRPGRVDLAALLDEVAAMVEPLAGGKGLDFRIAAPEEPVTLHSDAGKLRQILLNLVSNAVKFTSEGSVRLEAERAGDRLLCRVADTGIGIAAENHETIFEPFWQVEQSTNRTAGGTGLGLSVASRLAAAVGGTLRVESEPGRGTTFTLDVPLELSATPAA